LRQQLLEQDAKNREQRTAIRSIVKKANPTADVNDNNYIFLRFVGDYLPNGLVGLIIAIIFLASWGSIAAAVNSLASTTMVDFHKKFSKRSLTPLQEYRWSKGYTLVWAIICIITAQFADNIGNSLIEAVNILGSLFYGPILGIFLVAFYLKHIKGHAVFLAALIAEIVVLILGLFFQDVISFLWLNVIGAAVVVLCGLIIQPFIPRKPVTAA
jgi:solute:Na+ symporter, SSS family